MLLEHSRVGGGGGGYEQAGGRRPIKFVSAQEHYACARNEGREGQSGPIDAAFSSLPVDISYTSVDWRQDGVRVLWGPPITMHGPVTDFLPIKSKPLSPS